MICAIERDKEEKKRSSVILHPFTITRTLKTMELTAEEEAAVKFIAHGFRGGAPIRVVLDNAEATYGTIGWKSSSAQRHLLNQTVMGYVPNPSPSTPGFSFGSRRISRFVRLLLDEVERSSIPDGRLIELAASHALKSPRGTGRRNNRNGEEFVHIVVNGPDGRDIILRTSCGVSTASNDLGLRLWEGGVVSFLAVLKSPVLRDDIVGKNILELGSGLGLSAHALAAMNASRIILSDVSPAVLEVLRANVRHIGSTFTNLNSTSHAPRNSALPEMRVARVNVCERGTVARVCSTHAISTILCSDLTYDPSLVRMMRLLCLLLLILTKHLCRLSQ